MSDQLKGTPLEQALTEAERRFPIGRRVRFYPVGYEGKVEFCTVRSTPWVLGRSPILILVEGGRKGAVPVSRLEVI